MRENNFTQLFVRPHQIGLGLHTSEPGTTEQTMQAAHLLCVTTRRLLSRLDSQANARGIYLRHTNSIYNNIQHNITIKWLLSSNNNDNNNNNNKRRCSVYCTNFIYFFMFVMVVRGSAETSRFIITQSENAVRRSHHRRTRFKQLPRHEYVNRNKFVSGELLL